MIKFSKEKVLLLHQLLTQETGGTIGVRDFNLLDSALESAFQTFRYKADASGRKLSRIPKLILGAPGTSPAILLKPGFACVVALGYGIKAYGRAGQGIMAQWFMVVYRRVASESRLIRLKMPGWCPALPARTSESGIILPIVTTRRLTVVLTQGGVGRTCVL